jgi:ketosteroid isomerase-like protein
MSDDTGIRKVIEDRATAIRNRDADAAVRYYSEDAVNFDLAPPLAYRGPEATDPAELRGWFESWSGPIGLTFDRLEIHHADEIAFVHGLMRMTGPRVDGSQTDVWVRITLGLEKQDGTWRIVHEHQSFPTKMDGSGLSASDLKP